jgi:CDP-diacylglycerol--glycerol-3-phosphate 3-phosphatidyltransferase
MNLANRITTLRISLIPLYLVFLSLNTLWGNWTAAIIFIVAASTDILDGHIARMRKEVTNLGKLLDPLADKLLVISALIVLTNQQVVAAWVVIVIVAREIAVTGLRAVVAAEGVVVAASMAGKVKTWSQIVAVVGLMIRNFPFSLINFPFTTIAVYVAVVATIWSGAEYFIACKDLLKGA